MQCNSPVKTLVEWSITKCKRPHFYLSTAAYCFGLAFLLMDTTAVKKLFFRHLDAANDCILKLITLTQHKQSQASSAAAPGQRLTDNYCHLSNRSLGSSLAWLSVFQPHRDLNFFPLYWLAYLALTSSFFHHLCLSLVSSFSFSVTFSTLSRQLSLATLLVVSCFPHLSPSRGFIISLLSHPI